MPPGMVSGHLPETASVHWRPRVDESRLRRQGYLWTLTTVAHVVPFVAAAGVLAALEPLSFPVGLACLAHAWLIPQLYAQRGANVVRVNAATRARPDAERVALGLLGDLVGHDARTLHSRTGLVLERGQLGSWLLGQRGALLIRPGGRRVHCLCVGVLGDDLPPSDRIAHLLLALREDEKGFATVANGSFSGATWRVRRRLDRRMRPGLDAACAVARGA